MFSGRKTLRVLGLLLVAALVGGSILATSAPARQKAKHQTRHASHYRAHHMTKAQKRAIKRHLMRAVKHNPRVINKRWFLKQASVVNFALPATIRLTPAKDQNGHNVTNDLVNNTANLDLGPSLGSRTVGLGGKLHATINFSDAYDGGHVGDVKLTLPADGAQLTSTSVPLLSNPDVHTQAAPKHEVQAVAVAAGAVGDTFTLTLTNATGPGSATKTTAPIAIGATDAATASNIAGALDATLGAYDAAVSVAAPSTFAVVFTGDYAGMNLDLMTFTNPTGAAAGGVAPQQDGSGGIGCSDVMAGAGVAPAADPNSGFVLGDVDNPANLTSSNNSGVNDNIGAGAVSPDPAATAADVVLRTSPLKLSIDSGQAEIPGDGSTVSDYNVGLSGGRANLFGSSVNGLGSGNAVDVTVNLKTEINSIEREVDGGTPGATLTGSTVEKNGNISSYFNCRQAWTGSILNHLSDIHLVGGLKISPAITADGRLRIAKVNLHTPSAAKVAVAACLAPYQLYAMGNPTIGDNPLYGTGLSSIGPSLPSGDPLQFNPHVAINPNGVSAAPTADCAATAGSPLVRDPFNVVMPGGNDLQSWLDAGSAVGVSGDLSISGLTAEVLVGQS